jgi:hypothetical protein
VESAQVSNAPRCAFTACAIAGARLACRLSAATVTRSGSPRSPWCRGRPPAATPMDPALKMGRREGRRGPGAGVVAPGSGSGVLQVAAAPALMPAQVSGHGSSPDGCRPRAVPRTSARRVRTSTRRCAGEPRCAASSRRPSCPGSRSATSRCCGCHRASPRGGLERLRWRLCGLGGGVHAAALRISWPTPHRHLYLSTFSVEPPMTRARVTSSRDG